MSLPYRTLLPLLLWPAILPAAALNLQPPVTAVARDIYDLHTLLLYITIAIVVAVFGVMFYAIVRHRKSAGHQARQFHENTVVEVIWTVIPLLILVGMAWPATRVVLAQKQTRGESMTVKVTGYQWKWHYDYLDDGVAYMSHLATPRDGTLKTAGGPYLLEVDAPLVVPVGQKVRLLLTANDVIHSWWVPAFGVKQDAIPGFVRETWFKADKPGIYRGQCAELCGKDHGYMPIVVEVKDAAAYRQWLAAKKVALAAAADDPNKVWTLADAMKRGEEVYRKNCAACHMEDGRGVPGTFPALAGSKMATTDQAGHIDIVLNGSSKNAAMAAWGKQLSDTEIATVISYERNAWGNNTGQLVQPKDIKAARGGKV